MPPWAGSPSPAVEVYFADASLILDFRQAAVRGSRVDESARGVDTSVFAEPMRAR
jgi:hypothetical protein